jgi:hypothetical protein
MATLSLVNPTVNATITGNVQQARNGVFSFVDTVVTVQPGDSLSKIQYIFNNN